MNRRMIHRGLHLCALVLMIWSAGVSAGPVNIQYDGDTGTFTLENDLVRRVLKHDADARTFTTVSLLYKPAGRECIAGPSTEFECIAGDRRIQGIGGDVPLTYRKHRIIDVPGGGRELVVELEADKLRITLHYQVFPGHAAVRKWVEWRNADRRTIQLRNILWESISLRPAPESPGLMDVYGGYASQPRRTPSVGEAEDPAVVLHHAVSGLGAVIGNEAPGTTKYTAVYRYGSSVMIGMNPDGHDFAIHRFLDRDETFRTPAGFILLFQEPKWQDALDGPLAGFMRDHLGFRIYERDQIPTLLYNTWVPFRRNINDALIREVADALAPTGAEYLIIDDGWQTRRGDWEVDRGKFPDGLEPVCEYIRSKGMKPGLWIAMTDVDVTSAAYREFEDCMVLDRTGAPEDLHGRRPGYRTACLATRWYDYIRDTIQEIVRRYGIAYCKVDISAISSSYLQDPAKIGCYSTKHPGHRNRQESFYVIYRRIMDLFDELKAEFPDLFIDWTFELYGVTHGIDFALLQHADGDWLANIPAEEHLGPLRIRQLGWDRAGIIPPAAMVIGNQHMTQPDYRFAYHSLLTCLPIMLGDPRTLTVQQQAWFIEWHTWLRQLQEQYGFMRYYQRSDVFTRPTESGWDGCARLNIDKGGGILCLYRQNSIEDTRSFRIPWLNDTRSYLLYSKARDEILGTFTGRDLRERGITVTIPTPYTAEVLSVEPAP